MRRNGRAVRVGMILAMAWSACVPTRHNEAFRGAAGDLCDRQSDCGGGLVCAASGLCAVPGTPGTAPSKAACTADDDCQLGLVCTATGRCAEERRGEPGTPCRGDTDCQDPLVCDHAGACAAPGDPGTAGAGDACRTDEDCGFGLLCGAGSSCRRLPPWPGVACDPEGDRDGPPRLLFEVPRSPVTREFFRLPYPNDARLVDGVRDLSGFPGLEGPAAPADFLGRVVSALVEDERGHGLNPAAIFRFSTALDFETLRFGGPHPTFQFVDITPGSPSRGRRPRARFFATTDRGRYVCPNWLGIRPTEGSPLDPLSTYAVVFRKGIRDAAGRLLEPDADLVAVLAETPPEHPAVRRAWERYEPLRAWLQEEGIPTDSVIGATVFTTGDPLARFARLREAVHAAPAPELTTLTECDAATMSPCEGAAPRTCGAENEGFVELHARIRLPLFQRSTTGAGAGGDDIVLLDGLPRLQRTEAVCAAITVPRDAPPGPVPVVLYAHGIGGHFRSHVVDGVAGRLAALGYAVIGIDGVGHGERAGPDAPTDPAAIAARLYDPGRPAAMRDVVGQGVADLMQLARFARGATLPVAGRTVRFRRDAVAVFGHGFGGEAATLLLALEPGLRGGVLASTGGGMSDVLRLTRAPHPIGVALQAALADPELHGMHPGVTLLQAFLDARDPVNYGPAIPPAPADGAGARPPHVLLVAGAGDAAAPPDTTENLAIALRLERLGAAEAPLDGVAPAASAVVRGNVRLRGAATTRVVRQYAVEPGDDPHRVAFTHPGAVADVEQFFATLLNDPEGIPTVGK